MVVVVVVVTVAKGAGTLGRAQQQGLDSSRHNSGSRVRCNLGLTTSELLFTGVVWCGATACGGVWRGGALHGVRHHGPGVCGVVCCGVG